MAQTQKNIQTQKPHALHAKTQKRKQKHKAKKNESFLAANLCS